MIKLLMILIQKYGRELKIFISWDTASWHASKALNKKVEEVNSEQYRTKNTTPLVELVPLPTGAQFLNVIESVFSGMSRAISHNSDYQSVNECMMAIDRYFSERNKAFAANPRRAGKKIWGKERIEAVFKEENNCKDPNCRQPFDSRVSEIVHHDVGRLTLNQPHHGARLATSRCYGAAQKSASPLTMLCSPS
jgi:hypothetical protein